MDWSQLLTDVSGSLESRWPLIPVAVAVFYHKDIWRLVRNVLPKVLPKGGGDPVLAGLDAKFESCCIDDGKLINLLQATKAYYTDGLKRMEQGE